MRACFEDEGALTVSYTSVPPSAFAIYVGKTQLLCEQQQSAELGLHGVLDSVSSRNQE